MPYCPKCEGELKKIHRLRLDRAVSLVYPVYRYRCKKSGCDFEGCIADREMVKQKMQQLLIPAIAILAVFIVWFVIR